MFGPLVGADVKESLINVITSVNTEHRVGYRVAATRFVTLGSNCTKCSFLRPRSSRHVDAYLRGLSSCSGLPGFSLRNAGTVGLRKDKACIL